MLALSLLSYLLFYLELDGVAGFEPANDRIKICCLAA